MLEATDECYALTLSEISAELSKYGIAAERKTLYDDIETLRLFGLDVRVKRDRRVRYYVASRELSLAELKLIGDAVNTSSLLSEKERETLISRLCAQNGKASATLLKSAEGIGSDRSDSAMRQIDLFCKAIIENKKMRGRYFRWNERKQRIMQFGGERVNFSPWYVDLSSGEPTVIVYLHAEREIVALRADRFIDLELLSDGREGEREFVDIEREGRIGELLGHSAPVMLRIRADNALSDKVIDRFGSGITITSNREEDFEFSVKASADADLYSWVFGCGGAVEILAPISACEEYKKLCDAAQI
jgi:predicted DNA-binding transcriptional regulator YafY